MADFYDVVVVIDLSYGKGVVQKLSIDRYSPFDQTLFIDSDCLFYKDPIQSWKAYATGDFVIKGRNYLGPGQRHENVKDLIALFEKTGITRMANFNSGMFYFRKGELADRLFARARALYERRTELGLKPFKNAPVADEPVISVAMEMCGIEMHQWDPTAGMETWMHMRDMRHVNVIKGQSTVTKHGKTLAPAVIHYHVGGQLSFAYQRDTFRLAYENRLLTEGRALISACAFWLWYLLGRKLREAIKRSHRRGRKLREAIKRGHRRHA
jgi:hypothetical protein